MRLLWHGMVFTMPTQGYYDEGFMRKMVMDCPQTQHGFYMSHLLPLAKKSLKSDEK